LELGSSLPVISPCNPVRTGFFQTVHKGEELVHVLGLPFPIPGNGCTSKSKKKENKQERGEACC
jgi:hypothetical protein